MSFVSPRFTLWYNLFRLFCGRMTIKKSTQLKKINQWDNLVTVCLVTSFTYQICDGHLSARGQFSQSHLIDTACADRNRSRRFQLNYRPSSTCHRIGAGYPCLSAWGGSAPLSFLVGVIKIGIPEGKERFELPLARSYSHTACAGQVFLDNVRSGLCVNDTGFSQSPV